MAKKQSTSLFDAGFCIWLVCCVLKESTAAAYLSTLLDMGQIAAISVMILHEISSCCRYRLSDVVMMAIAGLFAISAILSHNYTLEMAILIIFMARHEDIDRVASIAASTLAVTVFFVFILSASGLTPDHSLEAISSRQARYSFGFEWPSRFPNYILAIGLYYVTCKKEQTSNVVVVLFVVLSYFVFQLSDSRNPFLCSLLLGMGVPLARLATRYNPVKWCFKCATPIFAVGALLMVVLSWIYTPSVSWLYSLNRLMSNRLLYSHAAFLTEFPSLLGSSTFTSIVDPISVGYLDSSYLRLVFYYGIIPTALFIGLLTYLFWFTVNQDNYFITVCMIVIAAHSILEGQLISLQFTPCLFFLPSSIRCLCREYSCEEQAATELINSGKFLAANDQMRPFSTTLTGEEDNVTSELLGNSAPHQSMMDVDMGSVKLRASNTQRYLLVKNHSQTVI